MGDQPKKAPADDIHDRALAEVIAEISGTTREEILAKAITTEELSRRIMERVEELTAEAGRDATPRSPS
jgi:hypothetical protein